MAKSPNKHNRIFMQAQPLGEDLTVEIEKEIITAKQDPNERAKILMEKYDWEKDESLRIWCFGPESTGPNVLVDKT